MTAPSHFEQRAMSAMERAGVEHPVARAYRMPWSTKDPQLRNTIRVHAFTAASEERLLPLIESALRSLPGLVRLRVIRGPEDEIGRERNLRVQVIGYFDETKEKPPP